MDYEGQICRAPMERSSYMLPIMVGCSYNKCRFCGLFKHLKFRPLERREIEAELGRVKALGGNPRQVFLGDGNAFHFSADYLLEIIGLVRSYFPGAEVFNMDATVTSILEKSDSELRALHDAGVRHLYLGIETGLDDVLLFMQKDHTLDEARAAISKLKKAGLIYDAHIMTGIAGHGRGEENALALAEFFNETGPRHVVNFSLFIHRGVALYDDILAGRFVPATELENLEEDRVLVSHWEPGSGALQAGTASDGLALAGTVSETAGNEPRSPVKYDSFHDNIEFRVRGDLPQDKQKMLRALDLRIEKEKNR